MPHVKLIVGLCGSGKSHLAKELENAEAYVRLDETYPDDPGKKFSADPGSSLSTAKFDELLRQLANSKDCAFTEAMLMFAVVRQEFEPCLKVLQAMPGVTIEWVFFVNDRDAANWNCLNDPNPDRKNAKGNVALNNRWYDHYDIPPGATVLPVARIPEWKPPHEFIAVAAYYIWEEQGRLHGRHEQHWFAAIQQLARED
jgi:hypothetical protein